MQSFLINRYIFNCFKLKKSITTVFNVECSFLKYIMNKGAIRLVQYYVLQNYLRLHLLTYYFVIELNL